MGHKNTYMLGSYMVIFKWFSAMLCTLHLCILVLDNFNKSLILTLQSPRGHPCRIDTFLVACALIVETSFPDSSPIKWPTEVDFYRIERFPWSICDRCGMPAGSAYPSGHLVPSSILGLANAPIVETKFLELAMSLLDFSPRIPLGTFSSLLATHRFFLCRLRSIAAHRDHFVRCNDE